ncbi:MAG: arylesterase [Nannocystis sp.]|nr:arylesterase [Nannocystis sp.]
MRPRHTSPAMPTRTRVLLSSLALLLACGAAPRPENRPASAATKSAPVADAPVILALGDSLTAGLGLAQSQAWPALLQARLDAAGRKYRVVNAGVSGDTTAAGLARLDWQLSQKPAVVILELGANDGLRGLPVADARDNLARIISRCQAAKVKVLLAGMQVPPNMGPEYSAAFRDIFPALAAEYDVPLIPFLLAGVAGDPQRNQADGIHPTAEGHVVVAATVWEHLQPLLTP